MNESWFISGNLSLEGQWHTPDSPGPFPAVVVCHPHPLYGGDMSSGVVVALCDHLQKAGIASFRFNFRGVEGSQGWYDGGQGEQQDAEAAMEFVGKDSRIDPDRLGLAGYSFGAGVAFEIALKDSRVRALALISPDLHSEQLKKLKTLPKPHLAVWGTEDKSAPSAAGPGWLLIPGVDHFWRGNEDCLGGIVSAFFAKSLRRP